MALSPAEKTILSNQMDVLRYGDATAKELIFILGAAMEESIKTLREIRGMDMPMTSLHTQIVLMQVSGTLSGLIERYTEVITDAQAAIIRNEYETVVAALKQEVAQARAVPDVLPKIPTERLRILVERPLGGHKLGTWIKQNIGHLEKDLRRELGTAAARGESAQQATQRLRDAFGLSRKGATVIARTALINAANEAREEVYKRFEKSITGYVYLATLDSRTCPVCMPWDGLTTEKRDRLPPLPQHPQCRCVVSATTRFDDPSTLRRPSVIKVEKKVTRHRDGSTSTTFKPVEVRRVPATTTYREFFESQPEKWQREVLGKTRFRMWKEGQITLDDLSSTKDARVLTIKELKAKIAARGG